MSGRASGFVLPMAMAVCVAFAGLVSVSGPATAQPFGAFGLHFNWENTYEPRGPERAICMTDRQIRQAIAARGYGNISLNVPDRRRVQVRATMGGYIYLLKFNFCNDTIEERQALRPAQ